MTCDITVDIYHCIPRACPLDPEIFLRIIVEQFSQTLYDIRPKLGLSSETILSCTIYFQS